MKLATVKLAIPEYWKRSAVLCLVYKYVKNSHFIDTQFYLIDTAFVKRLREIVIFLSGIIGNGKWRIGFSKKK